MQSSPASRCPAARGPLRSRPMARGRGSASAAACSPCDLTGRRAAAPISVGGRVTALAAAPDGTESTPPAAGAIAVVDTATG